MKQVTRVLRHPAYTQLYMRIYRYTSTLGSPAPRKMLVLAIGTLKNVGYLDRISNRISLVPLLHLSLLVLSLFLYLFLFHRRPFASSFVLTSLMWKTNSLIRTPFGKKKYPSCDCSCTRSRCILRASALGLT